MNARHAEGPPEGKIPLKLSRRELDLILREAAPALGLADKLAAVAVEGGNPTARLALQDWEEVAGYLTTQSYRLSSPKLQDQLDRLIERIEDLIDEQEEARRDNRRTR